MTNDRRVALVAGCRTPFVKAGTAFCDLLPVDLATACVRELVARTGIDRVGSVALGQVLTTPDVLNVAREVVLRSGLPRTVPAYTVNRACASAAEAVAQSADAIRLGHFDAVLAGGVESLSSVTPNLSRELSRALRARSFWSIRPRHLVPVQPAIAEPSTGLTMGQSAEKMARENGISREAQDEWALASHRRATRDEDLVEIDGVTADNHIRANTSREALSRLPPVFDEQGTVTAGNASPLTDGAAVILLMSEERAKAEGREPLAFVRAHAVGAVDPAWQALQGPAVAIPMALDRAGISLREVGLIEMHEAFAAQVLSNVQALESSTFAREQLGRETAVGEVDRSLLNVRGGSIALGHPFGATGARVILGLAREMQRRDVGFGLASICAQGGMGFAMVLER
jgi:acetyl-CoA acyltransferase